MRGLARRSVVALVAAGAEVAAGAVDDGSGGGKSNGTDLFLQWVEVPLETRGLSA